MQRRTLVLPRHACDGPGASDGELEQRDPSRRSQTPRQYPHAAGRGSDRASNECAERRAEHCARRAPQGGVRGCSADFYPNGSPLRALSRRVPAPATRSLRDEGYRRPGARVCRSGHTHGEAGAIVCTARVRGQRHRNRLPITLSQALGATRLLFWSLVRRPGSAEGRPIPSGVDRRGLPDRREASSRAQATLSLPAGLPRSPGRCAQRA